MITQSIVVTDPRNGKMAISNALSVSGSLKALLQDICDIPMRLDRNSQLIAGLRSISAEIGAKFKLTGDEGAMQSITTRIESFSQNQANTIQNLNESWSNLKESWINSLDSQKDHPKYPLYINIIGSGSLIKRGNTFYLVSGTYGRLVIMLS